MISQNKSKAITRIFLFFIGTSLLCLDLFYEKDYFSAFWAIVINWIGFLLGLVVLNDIASDNYWDYPTIIFPAILFFGVGIFMRISTLFGYLRLLEKD